MSADNIPLSGYVQPVIENDPDKLAMDAFTYISERLEGWVPSEAHLEAILINALASMVSEAITVAANVPPAVFQYFGQLIGIYPLFAAPASVNSTWTMIDDAGYTIPAGTNVGIARAGDEDVAFQVQSDVVVPVGSTATAAGEVVLVAVDEGEASTGLTGPATLQDALDFVDSIALVGATSGGRDAESVSDFLDRLSDQLKLMAPRPILPEDFATLARSTPQVARALAIDGYNPADGSFNNERMVAVAVIDEDGLALSSTVKNAVDADLQAQREVNFVVNVIDPTYTTINVTFSATVYPGFDPATVEAAAEAAVTNYLTPSQWGLPDVGGPLWLNEPIVRYLEVAAVIDRVDGLRHVTSLLINGGSVDVNLSGAAPLPTPGAISGTVS